MAAAPIRPGDILAGKYRIEHVLGKGGMAVVVAARHLHLNQRVALKFLLAQHVTDPLIHARFLREAQAAVQIRSEHVARILDFGMLPNPESTATISTHSASSMESTDPYSEPAPPSELPYIVMELLEGRDLASFVTSGVQLDMATAVDYLLQAGEAIAEAHANGIIHRDLKPANIFLTAREDGSPCIKVLDFGISKVLGAMASSLTGTATSLGSPKFMSPEQIRSAKEVDTRTDIWAMGVILFALLTGSHPFDGESLNEIHREILHRPAPPVRERRPDLPEALESVISRCLAKAREQRYSNMGELARALAPFAPPSARVSVERIERLAGIGGSGEPEPATPNIRNPAPSSAGPVTKRVPLLSVTREMDTVPNPPRFVDDTLPQHRHVDPTRPNLDQTRLSPIVQPTARATVSTNDVRMRVKWRGLLIAGAWLVLIVAIMLAATALRRAR